MSSPATVEEIVPLVEALPPEERARLLRLITRPACADAASYAAKPPASGEFSSDEDPLSLDSEVWQDISLPR